MSDTVALLQAALQRWHRSIWKSMTTARHMPATLARVLAAVITMC
jgi:hypothetical protein